eukprot:TRINITY_DN27549_c0_g1_i1.p1 TRINITY_DN27549_c0_g1~~TRINITY_DN27549_c0_g1_i1.p1  ORF type:complete len:576 (+),score=102.23 TRINITY_DN27549_c0_g1_i1:123-1850(+)
MERQKAPRTNRSKKTLPAAFFGGPPSTTSYWPSGGGDRGENAAGPVLSEAPGPAAEAGLELPTAPAAPPVLLPIARLPLVSQGIRPDGLVFLSSLPQRHGHAILKKMLHPPTLGLYCLVELPGADHQRAPLRVSLQDWLRRWCALQVERPDFLVAVCEAFWDTPQGYPMGILCEYMPLGSLDELLQACGGLPEEAMREIAQALLEALHSLHSAQPPVVHGCLKPSQVLFGADGRPRLAFGLEQRLKGCQAFGVHGRVPEDAAHDGAIRVEADGFSRVPSSGAAHDSREQQQSTAVDVFDLGFLLLVSALGGMEVLLDAIPYAREFGARTMQGTTASSAVTHDTCQLLQRELRGAATSAAPGEGHRRREGFGSGIAGASPDMGYLPPASDLLFNRRYSEPFLAFVSTCLEAHAGASPVGASELLQHEFLRPPPAPPGQTREPSAGPIVSLREMQELARLLNEAPDADPRSPGGGLAPSVAQSAQAYLATIAHAIAPHMGHSPRRRAGSEGEAHVPQPPPAWGPKEWDTLILDSARTLGLPKAVVESNLEAQLDGSPPPAPGAGLHFQRHERAESSL